MREGQLFSPKPEDIPDIIPELEAFDVPGERSEHVAEFFTIKDHPEKVVRKQSVDQGFLEDMEWPEVAEHLRLAQQLFAELREKYHIDVPPISFLREDQPPTDDSSGRIFYVVSDRIDGQRLDEPSEDFIFPVAKQQILALFNHLTDYFQDKFVSGGDYLNDIGKIEQYFYGSRRLSANEVASGREPDAAHVVLVDVGPTTVEQLAAGQSDHFYLDALLDFYASYRTMGQVIGQAAMATSVAPKFYKLLTSVQSTMSDAVEQERYHVEIGKAVMFLERDLDRFGIGN